MTAKDGWWNQILPATFYRQRSFDTEETIKGRERAPLEGKRSDINGESWPCIPERVTNDLSTLPPVHLAGELVAELFEEVPRLVGDDEPSHVSSSVVAAHRCRQDAPTTGVAVGSRTTSGTS